MTPEVVHLRADPSKVRVAVRRVLTATEPLWCVSLWAYKRDRWIRSVIAHHADPVCAVEKAMDKALRTRGIAVTFDGVDYPHPQRRVP